MSNRKFRKWASFIAMLVSIGLWFAQFDLALAFGWGIGLASFVSGMFGGLVGAAMLNLIIQTAD